MNPRPGTAGLAGPAVAATLLVLGLVPFADLIPGGHVLHGYAGTWDGWWSGTLLTAGVGALFALASRQWPGLWRDGAWERAATRLDLLGPRGRAAVTVAAFLVYLTVARAVFGGRPLLIDEIIQVWQARVYATGHLAVPSQGSPEFFGAPHLVDDGVKVFSQFPAGGPAMLALGSLVHAEWLIGPAFGALAVWATAGILRVIQEPLPRATVALLIAAFGPFVLFMSGSHMNHVPTLGWTALGLLGTAHLATGDRAPRWGLMAGAGFGLAAAIRPVDGFAFAAPVGLWMLWRLARDRAWLPTVAGFTVAAALPVAAVLFVNLQTTGHPFLFGYRLLWGAAHELGFHQAPWGPAHTPSRGLELISIYLIQLQTYFLETPYPALLPALLALALAGPLPTFDRLLLAGSVAVLGFYFAYWHEGFFVGPRFLYPLVPFFALWTGRAASGIRRRWADSMALRGGLAMWVAGIALALTVMLPIRVREYRRWLPTPRWPAGVEAEQAGVRGGLVLVRESFGAQVMVRMWALGLTRADAEFFYHHVDACRLSLALDSLAREGVRDTAAGRALRAIVADSSLLIPSPFSPDQSELFQPGSRYPRTCVRRIGEDRQGFTIFAPLLLAGDDNIWARDLHAHDTLLLQRFPDRPIWLLRPADTLTGSPPRFTRVTRDSLRRAWAEEAPPPGVGP